MGQFIKHTSCDSCGSSDGNALYDNGSTYCFVCGAVTGDMPERREKPEKKVKRFTVKELHEMEQSNVTEKPVIDKDEYDELKEQTTTTPSRDTDELCRGIRDDIYTKFGVRHTISENKEVLAQYYPVTQEGSLVGLKVREMPKSFSSIGRNTSSCELFMQWKFARPGKYVLLCEGELDSLAAYQMLLDYNAEKGGDFETAVVSPTVGVNCKKQVAANYKFFDRFDHIIVSFDNDDAGKKGVEEIVKFLPKGKVRIMTNRFKDANDYLLRGAQKQFINDFYDAQPYVPVGVLGSAKLYDRILEQAEIQKVSFPPFMNHLNAMLAGGMPLGHIINVAAKTGLGKTSFVNELVYYWVFNSPHKIGIVSMELDSGQYGEVLLSRHISQKISLIADEEEKRKHLTSENVRRKADELFKDPQGNDRFYLLDNRDGSVQEIQDTVEELIVGCGCRIIVLDPLQDILDGLTIDEQAVFMKWAKGVIKSHNVTFIFINHMRKTQGDSHSVDEEDMQGSSTIIKSASVNIILSRDKESDDEIERNTTRVRVTKNRICGLTGPAGEVYYDNKTHTMHNKDEFFGG